jgi:predicted metal-dependent peptidase
MNSIFNILNKKQINEAGPNGDVSWMGTDGSGKRWEDYDTIVCPNGQVIDMNKLLDDQQRAVAGLIHIMPFFGGFVSRLRTIYTFKVETQATDGYNLFVNPQFTYNLDMTGKVFVLAHEIMHCVLNHMRRGKKHDPMRSNIAADYEVNNWINDVGLIKSATMTKLGALYDKKYSGWGYEKIYDDNPSGPKDSMDNSDQAKDAQKNQQNQSGQQSQDKNGKGGGGNQKQEYSAEYKAGWNKAMEDYKAGKLKI